MPSASKLNFPSFENDKVYSLKGSTLNEMGDSLKADRIVPGPGQTESQTDAGRVITGGSSEGGASTCQLGGFVGGEMIPGWFIGGGKSELIEPGAITAAANKKIWLRVTWTAVEIDDVLQAGGTVGTVTVQTGSSVPDDSLPTLNDLTGIAYIPLGGWDSNTEFQRSGCGSVTLGFCPGGFVKGRGDLNEL